MVNNRRTDRVESLIRQTLGQLLLSKLSDPRIDPGRTSITHVEVSEDLVAAKVYVSILGTDAEQRKALRALRHAGGHLQELMMRQIRLRHTPILEFVHDTEFKKTLKTLQLIDRATTEIRPQPDDGQSDSQDEAGQAGVE